MQSLVTNTLPANWKTLFQERSENVLQDNPLLRDSHTLGPEWEPSTPIAPPMSQSEGDATVTPCPITTTSEGEGNTPISLSEGGIPVTPVPVNTTVSQPLPTTAPVPPTILVSDEIPPSRWNCEHTHNTRFRCKVIANFSPVADHFPLTTLDDYMTAFVAEQVVLQGNDQGNPMELNHYIYLAADSTDTLHYGTMLHDPDKAKFEVAMQDEINGLFRQDTIAVIPADTMPTGSKPLSAIWSFCQKRLPCWTIVKWKTRSVSAWWPAGQRGKLLA